MDAFLLTLVRHGETSENMLKIMQGHRNTCLSEKGIRQAELVAERLKHEHFTHVYTSDLMRAKQTCQIIMAGNTASSVSIVEDQRLRERNVGQMEGKSTTEWRAVIKSKAKAEQHGVESKQKLHERAVGFFQQVILRQMRTYLADHKLRQQQQQQQQQHVDMSPKSPPSSSSQQSRNSPSKKRKHTSSASSIFDVDVFPASNTEDDDDFFEDSPVSSGNHISSRSFPSEERSSSSSGCSSLATVDEIPGTVNPVGAAGGLRGSAFHLGAGNQMASGGQVASGMETENTGEMNNLLSAGSTLGTTRNHVESGNLAGSSNYFMAGIPGFIPDNSEIPVVPQNRFFLPTPNMNATSPVSPQPGWVCPNVTLLPDPAGRPLTRVSSIGSGRDVCLEAEDGSGISGSVLVVTHGGLIGELLSHFLNDLNCPLPGKQNAVERTTPNAAISRFSVRLLDSEEDLEDPGVGEYDEGDEWTPVHVSCLNLHDVDHIMNDPRVAPIATRDVY